MKTLLIFVLSFSSACAVIPGAGRRVPTISPSATQRPRQIITPVPAKSQTPPPPTVSRVISVDDVIFSLKKSVESAETTRAVLLLAGYPSQSQVIRYIDGRLEAFATALELVESTKPEATE